MKKFNINTNSVNLGFNSIIITKKYSFKNPIVKLISNNIKENVEFIYLDDKNIQLDFNIDEIKNYKLIIKDGLKKEIFDLDLNKDIKANNSIKKLNYKIETKYNKGKITIILINDSPLLNDHPLFFRGDLNKSVIWKKGERTIIVNFVHQIIGYDTIKFEINGEKYKKNIIDKNVFPTNLVKTKNGIRLNKHCSYDLTIKTDKEKQIIKKGETVITMNLDKINWIKVYYKDELLIEQTIVKNKFLPLLTICENPLRIKLSQPYYEDVQIKLWNYDKKFIIPQGKTEVNIPSKKGIKEIIIEKVVNATYNKKKYVLFIK